MSEKIPIGVGVGALSIALVTMVCTVVTSSFSSMAAGALSLLAFTAALVGFWNIASSFLRASGDTPVSAPYLGAAKEHDVQA